MYKEARTIRIGGERYQTSPIIKFACHHGLELMLLQDVSLGRCHIWFHGHVEGIEQGYGLVRVVDMIVTAAQASVFAGRRRGSRPIPGLSYNDLAIDRCY